MRLAGYWVMLLILGYVRQLFQVPALASIPIIGTEADRKRRKRINRYSGGQASLRYWWRP